MGCGASSKPADGEEEEPKVLKMDMQKVEQKPLGLESVDKAFSNAADICNQTAGYGGELMEKVIVFTKGLAGDKDAKYTEEDKKSEKSPDVAESCDKAFAESDEIFNMVLNKIPVNVRTKASEIISAAQKSAKGAADAMSPTEIIKKLGAEGTEMMKGLAEVMPQVDLAELKNGSLNITMPEFDTGCLGDGMKFLWNLLVNFVKSIIDFVKTAIGGMKEGATKALESVKALTTDKVQAEMKIAGIGMMQIPAKLKEFKENSGIAKTMKDYAGKLQGMIMVIIKQLQAFFNMLIGKVLVFTSKKAAECEEKK